MNKSADFFNHRCRKYATKGKYQPSGLAFSGTIANNASTKGTFVGLLMDYPRKIPSSSFLHLAALLVLVVACSVQTVAAATRGISINLRASEAVDAPISETMELYGKSYALVIGNDNYTNGWPKLSNAINDAEAIAKTMEAKGFDVEIHRNLTSEQLTSVFKKFFILKGDDPTARLFIWFAGHGATVDGEGYLIPVDAPVPSKGATFKYSSIALRDFGTYMRQAVSKHVYAVFDSCFAGTVFSSQRALPPAAITRATTMPVRQFLTSGDRDQTVSDDGAFRELFIAAVNGDERSDANGDGYVTASELGMFLGDRVTNLTQSMQTPRFGKLRDKDFDRGDFVFILPAGSVASALTAPMQASNGAGNSGNNAGNNAELAFWDAIKDSNQGKEFDAYLSQYPKGAFASLAMIKKNQLAKDRREVQRKQQEQEPFEVSLLNQDMAATGTANVRETPFPTAQLVARLNAGDKVWAIGETRTKGGDWYKIARDGVDIGFVYAPLLASADSTDRLVSFKPAKVDPPVTSPTSAAKSSMASKGQSVSGATDPGQPSKVDARLSLLVADLLQDVGPAPSSEQTLATTMALALNEAPATAPAKVTTAMETASTKPAASNPPAAAKASTAALAAMLLPAATSAVVSSADSANSNGKDSDDKAMSDPALERLLASIERSAAARTDDTTASPPASQPQGQELSTAPAESMSVADTMKLIQRSEQAKVRTTEKQKEMQVAVLLTAIDGTKSASSGGDSRFDEYADTSSSNTNNYLRSYISAANGGNADAQLSLAYMYETGEQVATDKRQAVRWYEMAADRGKVQAMLSLGILFEDGDGIGRDLKTAAGWYEKAALQGNADAQQTLGYIYENGNGVPKDVVAAARWYEMAAKQGRVAAQNNLGRFNQLGIGVPKNREKAIYWYEKAAAQGSDAAQNNLLKLRSGR